MDLDALTYLLSNPSADNWKRIVQIGTAARRESQEVLNLYYSILSKALPSWPKELERRVPETWAWHEKHVYENRLMEVDSYSTFILGICGDERLRLRDGRQGVRLERKFVGAARALTSERRIKVNTEGQADLAGALILEWFRSGQWRRLSVVLEVEIKKPGKGLREAQGKRQRAFDETGAIYLGPVLTVEEAVAQIVVCRDAAIRLVSGCD